MSKSIIVIGSGAAGRTAASEAKRKDPSAKVTVITEDEYIAYSPCVIPWAIEGSAKWEDIVMHDADFYAKERDITVLTKTKVESVSDADRKVVTSAGDEFVYDALVIATGSTVFVPPIEGKDQKGVFVVKTINDGKAIQAALADTERVVIGGAGVIGLELALGLVNLGKDVTIIEMMPQVIPRIADADMAAPIQKHLEEKGVKFVMNAPISKVCGDGKVTGVIAGKGDDAKEYPCEMVIFATGVRANLAIPKMLELDIGQLGAVITAPTMQAYKRGRLVNNIFLAGDVVQCQSAVTSGATMSQLGSTAVKQGLVAGRNAAGDSAVCGPVASPWVSAIGDLQIAGTGMWQGLASWYGLKVVEGKAKGLTRARYYPGGKPLTVKVLADAVSHRIIGAQIVSQEDVTGRINWLTSAIIDGNTAEDFIVRAENAYCPPTNQVRDVVLAAVDDLISKL